MRQGIFQRVMGEDSRKFKTVEEVDAFVESRIGKKLEVQPYATTLCSNRGSTHPLRKRDADAMVERELAS
jgi:hypothetical protein